MNLQSQGPSSTRTPHLLADVIRRGVVATIMFAGRMGAIHLELTGLEWTATKKDSAQKPRVLDFQRTAAVRGGAAALR